MRQTTDDYAETTEMKVSVSNIYVFICCYYWCFVKSEYERNGQEISCFDHREKNLFALI